jgi:hypothetical protein
LPTTESPPVRHAIKQWGHQIDPPSDSENVPQVCYHSNPSREYCNLPEMCCDHRGIGVEKPEDHVLGTHCEHGLFALDRRTGDYLWSRHHGGD